MADEENIMKRNMGPWFHEDGTPCPTYWSSTRTPEDPEKKFWCSIHQQHVLSRLVPPIKRMTEEEIRELALDYVQCRVYMPQDPSAAETSFGAFTMLLGGVWHEEGWDTSLYWDSFGLAYEYYDKAALSVNGLPAFLSMKVVHKDDMKQVAETINAMLDALRSVMPGG